jgi:hypothetical protein
MCERREACSISTKTTSSSHSRKRDSFEKFLEIIHRLPGLRLLTRPVWIIRVFLIQPYFIALWRLLPDSKRLLFEIAATRSRIRLNRSRLLRTSLRIGIDKSAFRK